MYVWLNSGYLSSFIVLQSAVSWDHKEKIEKHSSQKDYSSGFGGKFGVESDRQDRSAVGWDHIEKVNKHDSQKGLLQIYYQSFFRKLLRIFRGIHLNFFLYITTQVEFLVAFQVCIFCLFYTLVCCDNSVMTIRLCVRRYATIKSQNKF